MFTIFCYQLNSYRITASDSPVYGTDRICSKHLGTLSLLQDGKTKTLLHRHRLWDLHWFGSVLDCPLQRLFPAIRFVSNHVEITLAFLTFKIRGYPYIKQLSSRFSSPKSKTREGQLMIYIWSISLQVEMIGSTRRPLCRCARQLEWSGTGTW